MGSCAELWAIEAGAFERLGNAERSGGDPHARADAIRAGWEYDDAVVLARWIDPSDNDLSRIARGERRGVPGGLDVGLLAPLLGIDEPRVPLPWWVEVLWPADANEVGLLSPERARAVRDALAANGVLAKLETAGMLEGLGAFLAAAVARPCWILGVEGRS